MGTIKTEAGRDLLYGLDRLMPEKHDDAVAKILAVEAEAARIDPERLERVMHEVVCFYPTHGEPDDPCIGRSFAAAIARAYESEP